MMQAAIQLEPALILVAEDEPLLRMLAADALVDAGFQVVEATHAGEALAQLQARAIEIQVLFTDIHMPGGFNGLHLAHHARTHWPWIGLLIASGEATPSLQELPTGSRFLPKPYEPPHMVDHVRNLATGGM